MPILRQVHLATNVCLVLLHKEYHHVFTLFRYFSTDKEYYTTFMHTDKSCSLYKRPGPLEMLGEGFPCNNFLLVRSFVGFFSEGFIYLFLCLPIKKMEAM